MSRSSSSPKSSIEPENEVDHPSTDNSNNSETSSTVSHHRKPILGRFKKSVPLTKTRNFVFYALLSLFVSSLAALFSVITLKYPLKPEVYVDGFYVPAIDKITPNITLDKDLAFLRLTFNNRNLHISVSYDNFLNVTIQYYLPNSTTSILFANNATLPGFNQTRDRDKPIDVTVRTVPPGMSGLLELQNDYSSTMMFRVDLGFTVKYHCRELGKHKHQFQMTAEFEVSMEYGSSFAEDGIQMSEDYSS